jgi:mRNA interferase MazF
MTGYEFGDIVLVPFPFTDQSTTKRRPAVVISSLAYHRDRPDLIIMAVTSQRPTSGSVGEVEVQLTPHDQALLRQVLAQILG